jgi:hypothetical protein
MLYGNIPAELRRLDQWVCWRYERGTKMLKIAGTLRNAKSTSPETWRPFAECAAAHEACPGRYAGVGFVFAKDDPYAGVDLDEVRDPETGVLAPRAAEIVSRLQSYAEVSPSGTGVKLWVRAELSRAWKKPGVEVYPHARWFAVTGQRLPGFPQTVEPRQEELEALIGEEFPAPEEAPRRPYAGTSASPTDLLALLADGGISVLRELPDGTAERVWAIVCPWWREHTRGDRSGTRVGQYADGALFFHCEHAHCSHRGWSDFRNEVDPRAPVKMRHCGARRVWRQSA